MLTEAFCNLSLDKVSVGPDDDRFFSAIGVSKIEKGTSVYVRHNQVRPYGVYQLTGNCVRKVLFALVKAGSGLKRLSETIVVPTEINRFCLKGQYLDRTFDAPAYILNEEYHASLTAGLLGFPMLMGLSELELSHVNIANYDFLRIIEKLSVSLRKLKLCAVKWLFRLVGSSMDQLVNKWAEFAIQSAQVGKHLQEVNFCHIQVVMNGEVHFSPQWGPRDGRNGWDGTFCYAGPDMGRVPGEPVTLGQGYIPGSRVAVSINQLCL
ncbi:uncharacterized protein F4822DRAFT_401376 [Hypoxylon trugodes]|uniref:uncharacterized protein n=1 Tax=Hypoxylon trugodes TaxID=326681 RepID=UPI00218FEA13|nr:uncharacterized protein F4822DRAFT_401376 [Hypoxylon trugodes]KAI1390266.1 hypothetical protein F4822DRAFT_401376 [Hypoxylon trugodes]